MLFCACVCACVFRSWVVRCEWHACFVPWMICNTYTHTYTHIHHTHTHTHTGTKTFLLRPGLTAVFFKSHIHRMGMTAYCPRLTATVCGSHTHTYELTQPPCTHSHNLQATYSHIRISYYEMTHPHWTHSHGL